MLSINKTWYRSCSLYALLKDESSVVQFFGTPETFQEGFKKAHYTLVSAKFKLHHTARHNGYLQKGVLGVILYEGKYGLGYIIAHHYSNDKVTWHYYIKPKEKDGKANAKTTNTSA